MGALLLGTFARGALDRVGSEVRPFCSHNLAGQVEPDLRAFRVRRIRDDYNGSELSVEVGTREASQYDTRSHSVIRRWGEVDRHRVPGAGRRRHSRSSAGRGRHRVAYDTAFLRSLDFAGQENSSSAAVRVSE